MVVEVSKSLLAALEDSSDEECAKKSKVKAVKKKKKSKKKEKAEKVSDVDVNIPNPDNDIVLEEIKRPLEIKKPDEEQKPQPVLTQEVTSNQRKKLSNKEKRKLKAAEEAAERNMTYEAASASLGKKTNFAVSATKSNLSKEAFENALDVDIPQFTISAYGKTLFQDAHLKISNGRRYGVVGPNGKGKTTLLKQLASKELELPPLVDCLYVEQEVVADDTLAVDMVLQADEKRSALLAKESEILKKLDALSDDNDDNDADLDFQVVDELQQNLQEITDELKIIGNDTAEARALSILYGLGFDAKMQRTPTKHFSGGWRMRVSLACALFVKPTLLLLDEPTNHLDLNAVLWLDDYLQNQFSNTLLVVSHDQDFLDSVCTDIIHLDQRQLFYYRGNYSLFKTQLSSHLEKMNKLYKQQQKELNALKKSGNSKKKALEAQQKKKNRETGGAKKGKNRGQDNEATSSSAADLMQRNLLSRPKEYVVQFNFPTPSDLHPPIIAVEDVSFTYGKKEETLFRDLSFGLDMQSRITIVGKNGVGKSTLLNLITGELEPTEGNVRLNRHVRIGKYHQHFIDILPMNQSPVEYLQNTFSREKVSYQIARNKLGKFGLEGTAHELKMTNLSGGQKSRVVFTYLSFLEPHILILDEPTNNLDLESIDALIDAVNAYEGGVILVSHDARLITQCEMRLWVIDEKKVMEVADFDSYKDDILMDIQREEEKNKKLLQERLQKKAEERLKKMQRLESKRVKK